MGTNGLININNYCTHFIKLAGWQLSGVAVGWINIFPGQNLLRGNYPSRNFPGGIFPGWDLSRWKFSWWEFSWVGAVRVRIFRVGDVRVGIFQVGVFLGGNCPGGTYPGWEFSLVEVFRLGIVRWESTGWQLPMPDYVWICLIMPEYGWTCLNLPGVFCFTLYLEEKKSSFFCGSWKYLIFLCFRINTFRSKISNFLLLFLFSTIFYYNLFELLFKNIRIFLNRCFVYVTCYFEIF